MIYDVLICFPFGRPNGNALRIEADSHDDAANKRAAAIEDATGVNARVDGWPMLVIGMESARADKFTLNGVQVPQLRWYELRANGDRFDVEFRGKGVFNG